MNALFFQLPDLALEATNPLTQLLHIDHSLGPLFSRRLATDRSRRTGNDVGFSIPQLITPRIEIVVHAGKPRLQRVKLPPRLERIGKGRIEIRRAHPSIVAALCPQPEPVRRNAILPQPFLSSRLISHQIRRDPVLRTRLSVLPDAVARIPRDTVFITDRPPIDREALLSVHGRASAQRKQH